MADHNDFGKQAEDEAVNFLIEKGYKIIVRNWRYRKAEIDIIARKGDILHIIEVKARNTDVFASPEEAVNRKKIKLLIEAANEFAQEFEDDIEIQFDIISILKKDQQFIIQHIEDAFESID